MIAELDDHTVPLDYLSDWRNHPSMHPKFGDVMIRSLVGATSTSFIITDALTLRFISGPYPSIQDAVTAAQLAAASQRGGIWQENQDDRGYEAGPPTRIDPRHHAHA